jgi:regulator of protease activity HflC (stomatin/prohibitin superfamily)
VLTPGYCFYMPFIEEVYILDKSQQKFVMQGERYQSANHVPKLTVRASDGSSFYFEEMPIQYEIRPEMAATILYDSGPRDAFKEEWVKAHARSILRDEFGRFTAVQAANPTVFDQARIEAKRRLNETLQPHGIEVVLIGTPNPKFDQAYEQAIEDRKSADQEVERLDAKGEQLVEERERRLAAVEREKSVEMQELQGDLTRKLLEAERDRIQVEKAADAYATERRVSGEAQRGELTEQARGMVVKYTKEAEGIASQAQALEQRGAVVVREALIQKLTGIRFTLVPYSRDPAPQRLEHSDLRDATRFDPTEDQ